MYLSLNHYILKYILKAICEFVKMQGNNKIAICFS